MKISEHQAQAALVAWAALHETTYPELRLLFAIPNAAKRSFKLAAVMKAEGLKSGVPDLCLPVSRCGYSALFIEMKTEGGKVSDDQQFFLHGLATNNNLAVVVWDWYLGAELIERYMNNALPVAGSSVQQVYQIGGPGSRARKKVARKRKAVRDELVAPALD